MIVAVRDVHHISKDQRQGVVYVGRTCNGWHGSPLANPFKQKEFPGQDVVLMYIRWLMKNPRREQLIADLHAEVTRGGIVRPLACWCLDWDGIGKNWRRCHAQVLVDELIAFDAKHASLLAELNRVTRGAS